jgi:hypothetical protein
MSLKIKILNWLDYTRQDKLISSDNHARNSQSEIKLQRLIRTLLKNIPDAEQIHQRTTS